MTPSEAQITQLYVGYFDRAADPAGLAFWKAQADSGASMVGIAESFSRGSEYASIYGGLSNEQLLNTIYNNLFDRDPDASGKAYWLNELANGKPVGRLIVDVMSGAQGNDKVALDNTVTVAKDWTDSTAHLPFDMAAAQNAVQSIGEVQGSGVTVEFGSSVFQPYEAYFQAAMQAAWNQWGNHGRLDVKLDFFDLGGDTLAFAYARNELSTGQVDRYGTPITQSNVGIEVNTGKDMNGDLPDITITIGMNLNRFFQYDTTSILAHEIGHGLGFRTEAFDFDGVFETQTSWDELLSFPAGMQGVVHFNGPEAMAIYGGPVPITGYYNATHPLEETGSVMGAFFGVGEVTLVGVLDFAMMHDIGVMV